MYLAIIALPFVGSLFAGLRGRAIGSTGAQIVTTTCIFITCIFSYLAFYEVAICRSPVSINMGSWIDSGIMSVNWGFRFDDLTVSMLITVLSISSLVHLYSMSYISEDPHTQRFFSYLSLFTAFIVLLVCGDNYLVMFVGWEGIGVASYLLIGFWLTRIQAQKSAIKAMTINRVGDMILSIGFFAMLWACGNLDYATVLSVAPFLNETTATILGLLLLGGAISKSAQIPLQSWLPDAIEGPTPVSALIHAATLVTAGIYLMLRSSPLLEYGPTTLIIITWLGAFTALFAASVGLVLNDVKRIIAYSTCSQLGYMMIALGLAQYNVALFHLVNHAAFKALLFMGAGSVLHAMMDQQDARRLGGLVSFLPLTYASMLIGSLSLMAVPFLTGFYSKDMILEVGAGSYHLSGSVVYYMGTIAAGFTAFYSFRLICLVFFTRPNANKGNYLNAHEASPLMVVPLVVLSILSVVFGYLASDLFVGIGSDFLSSVLTQSPEHIVVVEAHFAVPTNIKLMPAIVSVIGAALSVFMYHAGFTFTNSLTNNYIGRSIHSFLVRQWNWNGFINGLFIMPFLKIGHNISKVIDKGLIETVGPYGFSQVITKTARNIAKADTSLVTSYALYVMLGLITLIAILFGPIIVSYEFTIDSVALILVFAVGSLII